MDMILLAAQVPDSGTSDESRLHSLFQPAFSSLHGFLSRCPKVMASGPRERRTARASRPFPIGIKPASHAPKDRQKQSYPTRLLSRFWLTLLPCFYLFLVDIKMSTPVMTEDPDKIPKTELSSGSGVDSSDLDGQEPTVIDWAEEEERKLVRKWLDRLAPQTRQSRS